MGVNTSVPEREPKERQLLGEKCRCIVSDPAQPHNVSAQVGFTSRTGCAFCGMMGEFHYYCTKCDINFHSECLENPSRMIHPYHPQHPLTFTNSLDRPQPNIMFEKCTWCTNDLGEWFYRCLICNFSLDFHCAKKFPLLTIQNPKNHHHSLTLFPRPLFSPCDACGLINVLEPSYACYQCNFVVHESCIDLPRVIKITRHSHRLSHTPCIPPKDFSCRVCYKNVDIKYGQYSCSHENCSFVVHSKCATHEIIWDGRELEWEPEESKTEDTAPFKSVGDGLIEHFGHDHHVLRLEKYRGGVRGIERQCQACIHPINSHDFYNCIECDYILHEVCANLPRKLDHALHKHRLFLDPHSRYDVFNDLICSTCARFSTGFKYKCREKECNGIKPFQLDMNCILVPECFTHKSHQEHLLFISTSYKDGDEVLCQGCKGSMGGYHLHCTQCDFAICYTCATIPDEIYHKYDVHPLSLCYGESGVDDMYWCEVCEKRLDPTEWFYTNNESCITIHRKCLLGDYAFMKSGHTFGYIHKVKVVDNGSSSRPICFNCQHHCLNPVYFKQKVVMSTRSVQSCSFGCLEEMSPTVLRHLYDQSRTKKKLDLSIKRNFFARF